MNRINLPQTMQVGDLIVTQATNCHVSICKDGRRVFHSPVDRPLDFDGLMKLVKMYKTIALRSPEPYQSRSENHIELRPQADLAEVQGAVGLCTMCALRKGMGN